MMPNLVGSLLEASLVFFQFSVDGFACIRYLVLDTNFFFSASFPGFIVLSPCQLYAGCMSWIRYAPDVAPIPSGGNVPFSVDCRVAVASSHSQHTRATMDKEVTH
jgi:hypothetical protein